MCFHCGLMITNGDHGASPPDYHQTTLNINIWKAEVKSLHNNSEVDGRYEHALRAVIRTEESAVATTPQSPPQHKEALSSLLVYNTAFISTHIRCKIREWVSQIDRINVKRKAFAV